MADRDILKRILERLREMEPSFTESLASEIERQIRQEYAGERVYIQKRDPDRRDKLRKRFNGNVSAASEEFGVTRMTIYRAIRKK